MKSCHQEGPIISAGTLFFNLPASRKHTLKWTNVSKILYPTDTKLSMLWRNTSMKRTVRVYQFNFLLAFHFVEHFNSYGIQRWILNKTPAWIQDTAGPGRWQEATKGFEHFLREIGVQQWPINGHFTAYSCWFMVCNINGHYTAFIHRGSLRDLLVVTHGK